jgi:hypothetical protein
VYELPLSSGDGDTLYTRGGGTDWLIVASVDDFVDVCCMRILDTDDDVVSVPVVLGCIGVFVDVITGTDVGDGCVVGNVVVVFATVVASTDVVVIIVVFVFVDGVPSVDDDDGVPECKAKTGLVYVIVLPIGLT